MLTRQGIGPAVFEEDVLLEMMDFGEERDPVVIAERLRDRIARASGWPLNDEILPTGGDAAVPASLDAGGAAA